ncbi:MAG: hypothetical protein ACFB9N_03140 [Geitlerinemataceae cyanobacterium]
MRRLETLKGRGFGGLWTHYRERREGALHLVRVRLWFGYGAPLRGDAESEGG